MNKLTNKEDQPTARFKLDKRNGKIMGVSAGMADYFNVDVTLIRVGWIIGTLLGVGSLILVYILIGLIAD